MLARVAENIYWIALHQHSLAPLISVNAIAGAGLAQGHLAECRTGTEWPIVARTYDGKDTDERSVLKFLAMRRYRSQLPRLRARKCAHD